MPKRIPLSHHIISIERAMSRLQSRDQHPKCDDCPNPADFTLETKDTGGVAGGYLDLCSTHFESRLSTEPGFLARVVAGLVRDKLRD
jgi:hypothetical protein